MTRRRFTEREALECAIQQGAVIPCFRCKVPFTGETVRGAEREHKHEVGLDGADTVGNCAYSHGPCHALVTNGPPATTAGSSKHRIAKTKRLTAETALHSKVMAGDAMRDPSRLRGRGFQLGQRLIPARQDPWGKQFRARRP